MNYLREWLKRIAGIFHKERQDAELQEELAAHLEMLIEQNIERGMTAADARRAARVALGGSEQIKEAVRDQRSLPFLESLVQDIRFGLRMLRKTPGFTAVAILTLALGIGANTAIFSVVDAVLLRTLPVPDPKRVVVLDWVSSAWPKDLVHGLSGNWYPKNGGTMSTSFSYPIYERIAAENHALSSVAALAGNGSELNISCNGQPERANGQLASGTFFATMGVAPAVGRMLSPDDDRAGASPVAVIGYGYWQRRFGADPRIAGQVIAVNGVPFTIVGVTAPGFYGVQPGRSVDVWLPLHTQPQVEPQSPATMAANGSSGTRFDRKDDWWVVIVGRLRPGINEQRASAELEVLFQQTIAPEVKASANNLPYLEIQAGGKGLDYFRREFSEPLFILMTVVGLVLLIACINIANLLLARGTSRQKEIAVRLAIGARRSRLVRQLLTESVLLGGLGGAAGLVFAFWGTKALLALMANGDSPIPLDVSPDLRVLVFAAGISLLAGILFGLSPALRATRVDLTPGLKEGQGALLAIAPGRRRLRLRLNGVLVIAQVSLSLVLLLGAGLFVRTLMNLERVNTGFETRNLLLLGIDPTQDGYQGLRLVEFYDELTRRLETLPGVRSVSLSHSTLIGGGGNSIVLQIPGYSPKPGEQTAAAINWVGPNFFRTMGIPLVLGRDFADSDRNGAPKAAVVNEEFARQFFGAANPIGRRFGVGNSKTNDTEIVGVVRDAKYFSLRQNAPSTLYLPWVQYIDLNGAMHYELRTAGDPMTFVNEVRQSAKESDPNLALYGVKSEIEQIDQSLSQPRLFAQMTVFFGGLALVLAMVGLYGVMAFGVSRRTREIGIRMALGASRAEVAKMVLRETLALVAIGIGVGLAAALAASRLIASLLFGVAANDPVTCAAVCGVLIAVALAACYLPARRAMRVDPVSAMRCE